MKGGLSSPMNNPHPAPNVHTTAGEADMSTGPRGHVNTIAADIIASPQTGPRRDATGERESECGHKQGW